MDRTIDNLHFKTNLFFALHWPNNIHFPPPKEWKKWDFKNGIPNTVLPGCYAILNEDKKVIYIGVGAGKGSGLYKGYGLGNRLGSYWKKSSKDGVNYEFIERWVERGAVDLYTLGISQEFGYLAYSLEVFLIRIFRPEYNVTDAN